MIELTEVFIIFIYYGNLKQQVNQSARCQMQKVKNANESEPCITITFCNDNLIYDLQIKLYSQQSQDHLKITIINKSVTSQFFYQSIFTMETIPQGFKAIYDSLPELFDYIQTNFEDALEIQLEGQGKENAILNIKVLIIKKIRQYKLVINGKPLTQAMKEEANLIKLMKEIEQKQNLVANLSEKNKMLSKQLAFNQRQVNRLAEEEKELIQKAALQVQIQQIQRQKNAQIANKINSKKLQLQSMYNELVKGGFTFTKEQINIFNSVIKTPPKESIGSIKKLRCDPQQTEKTKDNNKTQKQQVTKEKIQKNVNETVVTNQREKIKQGNKIVVGQQKQDKQILNKPKMSVTIVNKPKVQNEGQNILRHKRKLQIKDSEDNSNIDYSKQKQQSRKVPTEGQNIPQKNSLSPFMQRSSQPLEFINVGSSAKSPTIVKGPQNIVTVLSSSSQEQEIDGYSKQIGEKVSLDFSLSQNIGKYKIESAKSRTYIERIFDDKNFYHLYHKHAIKNRQNMQFNISQMVKHDFTFGIMGRDALKVSRLEWPKEIVCWVGCSREVVNQVETKKKDYWIEPSDSITVAVDIVSKSISFYINKKLMHKEKVQQEIIRECYFFLETASKGNKIYFF